MCGEITTIEKSHIIAGNHRDTQFRGELQGVTFIARFLFTTRALEFKIKTTRKILHPSKCVLACLVGMLIDQGLAYITFATT